MSLISDPVERAKRSDEKHILLLKFLRDETYSSTDVLGKVLSINSRQGISKALKRFESEGVIRRHDIAVVGARKISLWGITHHGLGLAWADESYSQIWCLTS